MIEKFDEIRNMTAEERVILADKHEQGGKKANHIVVRDKATGQVLLTKRNLVVRNGRELILRKIFNLPYPSESQDNLNTRYLCLFGIGSGGTPIASPFQPIAPTPADTDLNTKVPFRIATTAVPLTADEKTKYFDGQVVSGGSAYYKKTFSSVNLVKDDTNDDYYVQVTLEINESDARGALVSEIGIYTARVVAGTYNAIQLFSRITFDTESLNANTGKGLTIQYYVYA